MQLEENKVEEILCKLDYEGYIFPGFKLKKLNNQLSVLGKGGFSTVYEMECAQRPDR